MKYVYLLIAIVLMCFGAETALAKFVVADVKLGDGETNDTIDFGFHHIGKGKIGDFVWNDLNWNGVQDEKEPGINDVIVDLFDADGNNILTTTTYTDDDGTNGTYWFTGLPAGNYTVKIDMSKMPGGEGMWDPSLAYQGSDPAKDSNGI